MVSSLIQIAPPPVQESEEELIAQIQQLRKERNAVIMAHNYQIPQIQDLADFVGDSLALAREATRVKADVIVLCGVYFMAETAKLLNPDRIVIIPDPNAGCSLADSITAEQLREWKAQHPGAVVVSYVNTTAAVKAETDICCTSSNAEKVIRSIPEETPILFCPDLFLGDYLKRITGRKNMEIWPGECHVHAGIRPEEVRELLESTPDAELLIHPECGCTSSLVWARGQGMLPNNTYMLSTDGMIRHARASAAKNFIVATETGLLHRLQHENPAKRFFPADRAAVCVYMKMITLPKLRNALRDLQPQVTIPEEIAVPARRAIERMLAVS
ncbi:MAG: quinolinate synthase NadA [Chloroflexota bacterium]|nr:quinolinate synthase NadA [Dehalococcoidia bacterium]MDW8252975.1 quinolinate synthase NadA [Chloroflexota bacterium]